MFCKNIDAIPKPRRVCQDTFFNALLPTRAPRRHSTFPYSRIQVCMMPRALSFSLKEYTVIPLHICEQSTALNHKVIAWNNDRLFLQKKKSERVHQRHPRVQVVVSWLLTGVILSLLHFRLVIFTCVLHIPMMTHVVVPKSVCSLPRSLCDEKRLSSFRFLSFCAVVCSLCGALLSCLQLSAFTLIVFA